MGRPQLEDELILVAEIDGLLMLAAMQVPEMQPAAIFRTEQDLRDKTFLEGVGRPPLAGDERVMPEMPPGVVGEALGPAVYLPLAADVEGLVVHQEDAARLLALSVAQRGDVDALGAAMDGMGTRITRSLGHLCRLDDLNDLRLPPVGLGIDDVDARGAQPRHHQVPALDMRVRRIRAETGGARIPAEMMQLVARVRHRHGADDRRVGFRFGIDIDDGDAVGALALWVE